MEMVNFINDSTLIQTEVWFVPFDIIGIISTSLSIIFGLLYLFIIIKHKTYSSVQLLLVCNSCIAVILFSCVLLNMAIFTLQHDLQKSSENNTSFCIILGFLSFVTDGLQNYSYLLTAVYQYISVVYPNKIIWRTVKTQFYLIIVIWIVCIIDMVPVFVTGQISYNIDNQICQIPLRLSVSVIYVGAMIYMIPNFGIVAVYIKLTRYVHQMSFRTISNNTIFHARRELRLLKRTFILSNTLIVIGIPYMIFNYMSFFTSPPKYYFRIAYICVDISVLMVVIIGYCFTPNIKTIIGKKFTRSTPVEPMTIRYTART
ncbi:unnamed protein product [Adineta steineri]|uniref:G-protein coupled receptors family 1 profile domain-containing protein n=1 Tax=Adineta steineri TaxID=433720 RepID=A0A814S4A6_9BILA|nr:unnamed protein product [Adineta steineri]CAF1136305.1 unnamed protein product [Adineta steineri]CAF1143027.1 unnamed protein product [Adineta steineri]